MFVETYLHRYWRFVLLVLLYLLSESVCSKDERPTVQPSGKRWTRLTPRYVGVIYDERFPGYLSCEIV